MNEVIKKIFILIFMMTVCFSQTDIDNPKTASILDSLVLKHVDTREFMGSVLIAKDDEIILRKGYGYSDLENNIPNTPEDIYCIASITKLFTLSSIYILNERGLLSFEDPLSKYIPKYPNGNRILINHLISNKSGIVDYINEHHYTVTNENIEIEDLIDVFKDLPLNFEPGEKYSYCNSGWIILAHVIEKISGMNYSDFVAKNIFNKADMSNSFSNWNYATIKMARGYHKENGYFVQNAFFDPSQIIGSGNVITTVDDLYKWYNFIYKSEKDCMKYQFRFNGCFGGFRAILFINRTLNSVYIILSNYDLAPLDAIVNELDRKLLENQSQYNLEDSFDKYSGYYFADDNYYMIIEKDKNRLVAHSSAIGQSVDRDTLSAISSNQFINANISFTFYGLDSNKYDQNDATWGCNTYTYKRANQHFDKAEASQYVGKFILDNNRYITIRFNGNDNFMMQIENSDGSISEYIAHAATIKNFIYLFGRLIFDSYANSHFQTIKTNLDGQDVVGRRIE